MTAIEILDEIMKNFQNLPTNGSYSEMIKAQHKAFKASENLLLHELCTQYNKGYQDAMKFRDQQNIKNQMKNN